MLEMLQKNVEKTTNKIRLPQKVVDRMGNKFYMEVYADKIVLKPVRKGK